MKIVKPSYEIVTPIDRFTVLRQIEAAGRTCYKSEEKITEDSASRFVKMVIKRGHHSVIEHFSFSVRFICDRGVSHEIVRHRLASYSQESTRYCNYSADKFGGEITVIEPPDITLEQAIAWHGAMQQAECSYFDMITHGATPQIARSVLPNSLKTEIVMTANLREWRHFFMLRTDKAAHPQMRELAVPLLAECQTLLPEIFGDIGTKT